MYINETSSITDSKLFKLCAIADKLTHANVAHFDKRQPDDRELPVETCRVLPNLLALYCLASRVLSAAQVCLSSLSKRHNVFHSK